MNFTIGPDPFTKADRDRAMPDDRDHPVVDVLTTGQGPGVRCGQLVIAPTTSFYGIRPCLSVTTVVDGKRRHFNYPVDENGTTDWTKRVVGK